MKNVILLEIFFYTLRFICNQFNVKSVLFDVVALELVIWLHTYIPHNVATHQCKSLCHRIAM